MKIGIIGPSDSCEKIAYIINRDFPELEPVIYEVSKIEEAYLEIDKCERECSGLIFTGMGVYYKTIQKRNINLPNMYVPFLASSVMKALWELKTKFPNCRDISIDVVDRAEIEDVLDELDLKDINIKDMEFNHLIPEQDYVDFHINAHKENKACISIIALGWVFEQVTNQGYQTIRLYPTKSVIKNTIKELLFKINEETVRQANLAVQIIYIEEDNNISQYKKMAISSLLNGNIVTYLKELQGSIFALDWNKHLIFSTRGAVNNSQNIAILKDILELMSNEGLKVFVGTGFGMTTYESETNAYRALESATDLGESCIFKVEDNKIEGPLYRDDELSYNFITDMDEISHMAEKIDLSPIYIQKINSIKEKYHKDTFTSDELSKYLDISIRTANRILKKILDNGLGLEVGLESNKSVGRPKKLIKIDLNMK